MWRDRAMACGVNNQKIEKKRGERGESESEKSVAIRCRPSAVGIVLYCTTGVE